MYKALTPHWAGTLLGLVQIALIPIPFVFYKWGDRIRARSPMIRHMREDLEKSQKRAARAKRHQERLALERGDVKGDDNAVVDVENDAAKKTIETRASEKL
jgi:hypothetical protein